MVKIQIIGRLGKDAEKVTINGKETIRFFVGVDQKIGTEKQTRWLLCYTGNEKILPYLTKGKLVYVDGNHRITTNTKDGKTYVNEYVNASELQLLSKDEPKDDLPEGAI